MAAYNAEKTICESVASVLRSTHPFHLYIVDDCSWTPVADVLRPYDDDPHRNHPIGLQCWSRWRAQRGSPENSEGRTQLIAIMDADDLCHPERFAKQAAYLASHPGVAVVG